jgi:CHAT domain-containing protein/tetratricopeptide (TPR) repeat protein
LKAIEPTLGFYRTTCAARVPSTSGDIARAHAAWGARNKDDLDRVERAFLAGARREAKSEREYLDKLQLVRATLQRSTEEGARQFAALSPDTLQSRCRDMAAAIDSGKLDLKAFISSYALLDEQPTADELMAEIERLEKIEGSGGAVSGALMVRLVHLYQRQGRMREAEPLYRRRLDNLERHYGRENPEVGKWLLEMAGWLESLGRYREAEPLIARSVAILERTQAAESPWLATARNELSVVYQAQGRYKESEDLLARNLAIAEKVRGPEHPETTTALNNLASVYKETGRFVEANALLQRSLAVREKVLGPDHPDTAFALNNLADLRMAQGRYGEAAPLLERSLAILEKRLGPEDVALANVLNNLGLVAREQGRLDESERFYRRSLAIWERAFGPDHPASATSLGNLGGLYTGQARFEEAEKVGRQCLSLLERSFGPDHPSVARQLNNMAVLQIYQGRYADAESLFKRGLAGLERSLGPEHPKVASTFKNLAVLSRVQGRSGNAEALYRRSLAIWENAFGPEHPDAAVAMGELGELYWFEGRVAEAEPLLERALATCEKFRGSGDPHCAGPMSGLSKIYRDRGQFADAERLTKRSAAIYEKTLGPDHPAIAFAIYFEAYSLQLQGRVAEAEPLYRKSLAIMERSLGPGHPGTADPLEGLSDIDLARGRRADALAHIRRASDVMRTRMLSESGENVPTVGALFRARFLKHLRLLEGEPGAERNAAIIDESFGIGQLAQATGTGVAVARMAARFASGDDGLAVLAKRRQDLAERLRIREEELAKAGGASPEIRSPAMEQRLREDLSRSGQDLARVDAEIRARFPQYEVLTRPEPLGVRKVQSLMRPGEALVAYTIGEDGGWLWVIRPGHAAFVPLKLQARDLASTVRRIRGQVVPDASGPLAATVDVQALHDLHQALFAPAVPHLVDVAHVMLVLSGPLESLPFQLLVTSPPKAVHSPVDYRDVDWLAKRYALTVLPSVGSIRALREFAKAGRGREPFAGFGDPRLDDGPGASRGGAGAPSLATLFRGVGPGQALAGDLGLADVRAIRKAPSLPESALELRAMAKTLHAGESSLWLRERATERAVKSLELSRYRVIAFATHGVMAGELSGVAEPGLILTPPAEASAEDDGYLSASEIAQLRLNADWVLLSACNTAAGDGTPGAEGLSGLAKAFFYAGSRSLFVSHWPVASEATVLLTTAMLRNFESNPAQGKGEAHRRAILAMMNTPGRPEYSHPFFWAPFVVVGEGGHP